MYICVFINIRQMSKETCISAERDQKTRIIQDFTKDSRAVKINFAVCIFFAVYAFFWLCKKFFVVPVAR